MLRNSTQKFREKYQRSVKKHYQSTQLITTKMAFDVQNTRFSSEAVVPAKLANSKKIESPFCMTNRTFTVKNKQNIKQQIGTEVQEYRKTHRKLMSNVDQRLSFNPSSSSVSTIKWLHKESNLQLMRDPSKFIEELPKNSVFFCCKCFQYIFQIEKKRHFPECKDEMQICRKSQQQFQKIAWNRLQLILKLSEYTQTKNWQLKQLYLQVTRMEYSKILTITYPINYIFFTLDQIVFAFVYTYEKLLQGVKFKEKSHFFECF